MMNHSPSGSPENSNRPFWQVAERTKELRESEEVLSQYMRHSPLYTYIKVVTPTENRMLLGSDSLGQMPGLLAGAVVGKTMIELFPPELAAKITNDDWAVVSQGKVLQLEERCLPPSS